MATRKFGFLKFNTDDGFAFRIGNGQVHRLGGKKDAPADEDAYESDAYLDDERYVDDAGDADFASGYTGRFNQPSGGSYYDDEYDDDYADDYADDDYVNDDYVDDGYADEGYDDGYADDEYYDDDGYTDLYSDEDAADYGSYSDYGSENPVLRYIDENDWVTYVLLFLLPPLGIYLLWRRRRFEQTIRWVVSAVSGIWFILLIILLVSAILSGRGDMTANSPITMTTPTPTPMVVIDDTPEATGNLSNAGTPTDGIAPAQTVDALAPDASATPLPDSTAANAGIGNTVLMTATGAYYHNNANCQNLLADNSAVSNVTVDVATQRGKTPCPTCYPGQEQYYSTANGRFYHSDQNCTGMTGATVITKEAAEERGQTACPVCVKHDVNSLDTGSLRFADTSTTDQSGITVYATTNGRYFHTNATCTGMTNATSVGLLQAMLAGKTACPTCASSAGTLVWFTKNGKSYHNNKNCSGMEGAYQATLAEAMILGKGRCTVCWGKSVAGISSNGTGDSGAVYVYATQNGQYYHTNATCTGMTNAQRVPLTTMVQMGRKACPTCASGAETVVYATQNGQYYHSYATCTGMTNASATTMARAMAAGKKRCPECWKSSSNSSNSGGSTASGSSGVYVYATKDGKRYHTSSSCSGMTNAVRVDLSVAVKYGKTACSTCASAANRTVYSSDNGGYYHASSSCSGLTNGKKRTLQDALLLGQSACPVCIRGNASGSGSGANAGSHAIPDVTVSPDSSIVSSGTYTAGTSGVKVYATANGKYYHTSSSHAGPDTAQVSLETALNYGKTACPTCASAASRTVYAVRGGRYYHTSSSCAGSGAVSGHLDAALAYGLDACPICVTRTQTVSSSGTYVSGTSGIKVYATTSGSYYHISKSDAGVGAAEVTLETALNYGKTACPNCSSAANITVYSSVSDRYYHASRTHAGSGASSAHWATALAVGKKACPVCVTGSEAREESDIKYSAPGDTRVYIDVGSTRFYYHSSSSCSDGGMSGGTGVALDFVLDWGFHACPYCNPPTSAN